MPTGKIKVYSPGTQKAKSPHIGILKTSKETYDFAPKHLGPDLLEDAGRNEEWDKLDEKEVDFDLEKGEVVRRSVRKKR